MKNNKMTKDTVPKGVSVVMALVDLIPVVFFGLSAVRVGRLFQSALFVTGALICLLSGVVKVLWKLIAAVSRGSSIRATRARTGSSRASTLWRRSASISACCRCEPIVMRGIRQTNTIHNDFLFLRSCRPVL